MAKSKVLNPKAWYLVGAGAVALAADGARRLIKRRRQDGSAGFRSVDIPVEAEAKTPTAETVVTATPTAEAQAKTRKAVEAVAEETKAAKPKTTRAAEVKLPADDLTEIKGIGPVFAERLRQAGIMTFADIAKASPDQLREATHATSVANPDEWIAQAKAKR